MEGPPPACFCNCSRYLRLGHGPLPVPAAPPAIWTRYTVLFCSTISCRLHACYHGELPFCVSSPPACRLPAWVGWNRACLPAVPANSRTLGTLECNTFWNYLHRRYTTTISCHLPGTDTRTCTHRFSTCHTWATSPCTELDTCSGWVFLPACLGFLHLEATRILYLCSLPFCSSACSTWRCSAFHNRFAFCHLSCHHCSTTCVSVHAWRAGMPVRACHYHYHQDACSACHSCWVQFHLSFCRLLQQIHFSGYHWNTPGILGGSALGLRVPAPGDTVGDTATSCVQCLGCHRCSTWVHHLLHSAFHHLPRLPFYITCLPAPFVHTTCFLPLLQDALLPAGSGLPDATGPAGLPQWRTVPAAPAYLPCCLFCLPGSGSFLDFVLCLPATALHTCIGACVFHRSTGCRATAAPPASTCLPACHRQWVTTVIPVLLPGIPFCLH